MSVKAQQVTVQKYATRGIAFLLLTEYANKSKRLAFRTFLYLLQLCHKIFHCLGNFYLLRTDRFTASTADASRGLLILRNGA